jgi:N-acetylmuramoyl-L-alanine amidase
MMSWIRHAARRAIRPVIPLALATGAFCAWVAAPALSLDPYLQGAVDFERDLPQAQRLPAEAGGAARASAAEHGHAHAEPRWITPPVAAQHEFDLVGIGGEMRPIEIRVRDDGGDWSEWVETHSGDPVYVGGAREAQVRASFKPRGELHFVNVSGTAGGTPDRLLQGARESINSAFISAASTFVAEAAAPKPKMISRATWGATQAEGGCAPRGPAEYGEVQAAVIHHTVNANDYTKEEAAGIVLGICRFHVNGNGWNDIGYQALVDRFGRLYKGRAGGMGAAVVGAQAQGFNAQTTAIASIGTNETVKLSKKARNSVTRYVAWKLSVHGLDPDTMATMTSAGGSLSRYPAGTVVTLPRVIGHRDLGETACPGERLYAQVKSIRKLALRRMRNSAATPARG